MVLDGFGWFWMVFGWIGMEWDGLGWIGTYYYPYYIYFYPNTPLRTARRHLSIIHPGCRMLHAQYCVFPS